MNTTATDSYPIKTTGVCVNISIMLLISVVTSIIPLLLNSNTAIFYTSQPLYITIIILFFVLMYYKFWGLMVGAGTFIICGTMLDLPNKILLINSTINIIQLLLLLIAYLFASKIRAKHKHPATFSLSIYNFFLFISFILYIIYNIWAKNTTNTVLYAFAGIICCATLIKSLVEKDIDRLYFTILIATLPSLIASISSAIWSGVPNDLMFDYIITWTLSNYILLQTCGYLAYKYCAPKRSFTFSNLSELYIQSSSILYYIATIIWNLFILYMMYLKVLPSSQSIYFFPWALGNIFLISNLYFSRYNDTEKIKKDELFKWHEGRVITVEKNTSGIIAIISFLLPLSVQLMGKQIPTVLVVIFIANIFCACLSVGLIWTPQHKIKFISTLKTIKTIFYLYSIALLLLSVMMIMFYGIQ